MDLGPIVSVRAGERLTAGGRFGIEMGGALQKKLRIQPGLPMLVLNAPEGYMESLGALPEGARIETEPTGTFD